MAGNTTISRVILLYLARFDYYFLFSKLLGINAASLKLCLRSRKLASEHVQVQWRRTHDVPTTETSIFATSTSSQSIKLRPRRILDNFTGEWNHKLSLTSTEGGNNCSNTP
ncbi:transmembrane protein, putative [Medicago truncatula]|uniref:Transmembrane protein, putative n=1 Tax=Medicago truncatula TaxID=3880 RepID=A0A072V5I5_MEDTR|nr:transmembrane protein, putative [Medicago truncatula]